MKFSKFFLLTFFYILSANAQVYTGTVNPPNGGKHATIYKDPGFNWKNCEQYKSECVQLDWLTPGTEVKVTNVLKVSNIPGNTQAQTLYYEVEFSSDGQTTKGYVESSYIRTSRPSQNCPIKSFGSVIGDIKKIVTSIENTPKKPEEPLILLPLMSDVTVFNRKCKNFIDESGKLGEWGTSESY